MTTLLLQAGGRKSQDVGLNLLQWILREELIGHDGINTLQGPLSGAGESHCWIKTFGLFGAGIRHPQM